MTAAISPGGNNHPGINLSHADAGENRRAETTVFGFWVFLMSDAVLFGLLFATYGVMRAGYRWRPWTNQSVSPPIRLC
ncbi:MAG: hypothetical protein ACYDB8_12940 [Acidiferrobacterales bacterium]